LTRVEGASSKRALLNYAGGRVLGRERRARVLVRVEAHDAARKVQDVDEVLRSTKIVEAQRPLRELRLARGGLAAAAVRELAVLKEWGDDQRPIESRRQRHGTTKTRELVPEAPRRRVHQQAPGPRRRAGRRAGRERRLSQRADGDRAKHPAIRKRPRRLSSNARCDTPVSPRPGGGR